MTDAVVPFDPVSRRTVSAEIRGAIAARFHADMKLDEFRRLDREFHWAVARACGNDTLAELYGKVLESLFASRAFDELLEARSNRKAVREIIRSATVMHQTMAAAIV